jgi:penicillin-binding protein 1A
LEKKYSKKKILELYLNTVYFGQGCYGVETAARTFFGKSAKDLTLAESALLAGLPGAPNYFSPYINPKLALQRRNTVLEKMVSQKYISRKEAEQAKKEPITVLPIKTEEEIIAPYFVEHVKLSLINKYGANMVYRGGLRIYTTLDLRMQQVAEEAVYSTMTEPDHPSAALAAIEPKTGYIKALVGGKDFKNNQFNLATQAKRSPGSAFKTFTLVTAIENGISPNKTYDSSAPRNIKVPDGIWRVENYEGRQFSGPMSTKEAMVWSVNAVYAQLIMDVGAQKVADIAHRIGILTPVPPYPAITLGGLDEGVSPLEMASAYGTLANDGVYARSTAILKVTDAQGNIIEQSKSAGKQVIGKNTARIVNSILKEVINRGTGRRAFLGRPAAGKTGSAEYMQDAWFVGYTPDLSAAVWMGYPSGSIQMGTVHGYGPYGGGIPAIIWRKFMSKALEGVPWSNFIGGEEFPDKAVVRVTVCTESELLPNSYCPSTKVKTYPKGKEPTDYCNIHEAPEKVALQVPNVIGKPVGEATDVIAAQGLVVNKTYEANSQVPKDQVISQSPQAGTSVDNGTTVTIVVSSGPPLPAPQPPTTQQNERD